MELTPTEKLPIREVGKAAYIELMHTELGTRVFIDGILIVGLKAACLKMSADSPPLLTLEIEPETVVVCGDTTKIQLNQSWIGTGS